MNSRVSRYYRKKPNFSTLPVEILRHIALFLPREGVKPTRGKITSNYYNNSSGYAPNIKPEYHGRLRYQLVNSPTRPLTERTKQMFANAQKKRKNVARKYKNEAAHEFLYGLYNDQPINIISYVNGGSPIYASPDSLASPDSTSNVGSYNSNLEAAGGHVYEAVGGHMYLNANFKVGPNRTNTGTRDNFMRTSKSVRAAVRSGPKKKRR